MVSSMSGLFSQQQNILNSMGSSTRFQSIYNVNGGNRIGFNVEGFLPVQNASTNFQAREFSNFATLPVLQYLNQRGIFGLGLPYAFNFLRPDGIPTASQLTGFGMGAPQGNFPGLQMRSNWPPVF